MLILKKNNKEVDDSTLIKDCIKNNRTAQYKIYKKYSAKFLGVLFRYVGNREEAEDLLQEGFIKVFNNLDKFSFNGNFEGWAKRIMVNLTIDYLRKKNRLNNKSISHFEPELNETPDTEIIEDDIIMQISPSEIVTLLDNISPAFRVNFNLYHIEGYTHKEISDKLGISIGTSKSNTSRGRKQLRFLIKDYLKQKENEEI